MERERERSKGEEGKEKAGKEEEMRIEKPGGLFVLVPRNLVEDATS